MNTGLDSLKIAPKKVVHKAGEFIENTKQMEKSIIKLEHYKISKLLKDSSVSKFVTKRWIEVNDL